MLLPVSIVSIQLFEPDVIQLKGNLYIPRVSDNRNGKMTD